MSPLNAFNTNYEGWHSLYSSPSYPSYQAPTPQSYVPSGILSPAIPSFAPPPPDLFDYGFINHTFPNASRGLLSSILKLDRSVIPNYVRGPRPYWTVPARAGRGVVVPDFAVRADDGRGPVLPQDLWQPRYASSQEELVLNRELCDPIFFLQENSDEIGIPILEAQAKKYQCLSRYYEPVSLGGKVTTHIRILYGDYPEYKRQLQIRDETAQRNPVTRGKLAQHVAKSIVRFLSDNMYERSYPPPGEEAWLSIGPGGVMADNVILVGVVHVSAGTLQPILRLARPLPMHASF